MPYLPFATGKLILLTCLSSFIILSGCASVEPEPDVAEDTSLQYPYSSRTSHQDTYHGQLVADPYFWLEDTASQQTRDWVQAQNLVSETYLSQLNHREALKERLTQIWNYQRLDAPFRHGRFYFHLQNDGLQNQSALYVREGLDGAPRVLLDPNQFSSDGAVSLAQISVSPQAGYVAYALSDNGSDWVRVRIRNIQTGQDREETLHGIKFSTMAWLPDESGFYYSRYPDTPAGEPDDSKPVAIYFHRLGSSQRSDRRIYDISQYGSWNPYPRVTRDGRFLLATVTEGFTSNAIHLLDLNRNDARWQPIINQWDGQYEFIASDANLLFFRTTANAPTGRVIAVDLNRPHPDDWQELIPAQDNILQDVRYVGGKFFVHYLHNAQSRIDVFNAYGRFESSLELPEAGTVQSMSGDSGHLELFFSLHNFTKPGQIFRYDVAGNTLEVIAESESTAQLDSIESRQVTYTSKDGTDISMFIVHRNDITLDGSNPALLYGYGGFNISLTPAFNPAWALWLEQGGILAIPNLRGGGEYGTQWHQAGTRQNKQTVFDDYLAAAHYLFEQGYTSYENLIAQGASNGGLLVGAAMVQQPDTFAAVLPDVGVFDMLRYHTSNANARAWSSEFGIATNPQDFPALYAYSPVHKVAQSSTGNVCYPATLITTGDNDDRVAPWHSYKFTAALQHAQSCDSPVLLRVETRAGHGAGSPTWMKIEQIADQFAFALAQLKSFQQSSTVTDKP